MKHLPVSTSQSLLSFLTVHSLKLFHFFLRQHDWGWTRFKPHRQALPQPLQRAHQPPPSTAPTTIPSTTAGTTTTTTPGAPPNLTGLPPVAEPQFNAIMSQMLQALGTGGQQGLGMGGQPGFGMGGQQASTQVGLDILYTLSLQYLSLQYYDIRGCFTKTKFDFKLDLTIAGHSCHWLLSPLVYQLWSLDNIFSSMMNYKKW